MSLYDTLQKSLSPELFAQVTDQLGDDFDYDVVPRTRLNKVIRQRNDLRDQLAAGAGQSDAEGDDGDNAGSGQSVDEAALRRQFETEKQQALNDLRIQFAVLQNLRDAGAIDAELIFNGGLVDKSKLSLDTSGGLVGFESVLQDLQTNKAHLFKKADDNVPAGTGKQGSEQFSKVSSLQDLLELSADEQYQFKQANPTLVSQWLQQQPTF